MTAIQLAAVGYQRIQAEAQCGDYLGEDDIVRYEDVYGRVQESARA